MSVNFRILLFCLVASLYSCNRFDNAQQDDENVLVIECGAEKCEGGRFLDKTGKFELTNAQGITDEEKRTGLYALRLVKENPYGMGITIENVKKGDYFNLTVWRKGGGHLCATANNVENFARFTDKVLETDENGWQKLSMDFFIPPDYKENELKIFLANFDKDVVYFDDLKIVRSNKRIYPKYNSKEVMNIFIDDESFKKIKHKRDEALKEGILTTADDDWVKAIIFHKNQVFDTRIRLKGDRLDHLQGRKWSFRIKIKGENAWNGMKTFSIQTPAARLLLHEWLFHKALEKEDILCTRYGFVPVFINGESVGIYAWEEHFEKQLIENSKRREGPILKLSDDSYWIYDRLNTKTKLDYNVPSYDASVIMPFNQKNVLKDSIMFGEFKRGRDLLEQYKYALGTTSEIFDVEAVAKYYAMLDATNAYHTLHFFNQRFYYNNPVLGKLEPIFYDSFPYNGIFDFDGVDLVIGRAEERWLTIHLKLFADLKFKNLYFRYLEKYSSQKFWKRLYAENEKDIRLFNEELKNEFVDYNFDITTFYQIAEEARLAMEEIKKKDKNNDLFNRFKSRWSDVYKQYHGKADFELLPHLINVYTQGYKEYRIENYSTDSVIISGFSDIDQVELEKLGKKIILPPANSKNEYVVDLHTQISNHKYLFVEIRNKKVAIPIIPWESPNRKAEYQDVSNSFNLAKLQKQQHIKVKSDTLVFSGDVEIKSNLIIPENWIVSFENGTTVDLIKGATFISYSPVFINGTNDNPVVFVSSDHTGKGINVFQTKQRSVVKNASFSGFTNMEFGGWLTTAAVCFYEANVDLRNVTFKNNFECDDALNVVRSDYLIENCEFKNTFADAFDSDFCTGKIVSTKFLSPGNDALDFSGSTVNVENCLIMEAGDKSISCGEESTIVIQNCKLEGSNIGIASKDKSEVWVEDSSISDVTYGLVAFCKKPEYGPARITTKKLILKKYLFVHLIEEGSNLNFNNREIFGQERKLVNRFY